MRRHLPAMLVCALVLALAAPVSLAASDIPKDVKKALDEVISKRIKDAKKKGDDGRTIARGQSSKNYIATEDGYRVAFYEDKIYDDKERKWHRYELQLTGSGTDWSIANEKEVAVVEGFVRRVPGDEGFHSFTKMNFEEQGLKISSGPGTLIVEKSGDDIDLIHFASDSLTYEYEPPVKADYYDMKKVLDVAKTDIGDKYWLEEPVRGWLTCTPPRCEKMLGEVFEGLQEVPKSKVNADLVELHDEVTQEEETARDKNNYRGFTARYREKDGEDYYQIRVADSFRDGDNSPGAWIQMNYDKLNPREVGFGIPNYRFPMFSYHSDATRAANVDPRQLSLRPDKGARMYDITKVDGQVDLGLEEPTKMTGDVTFRVRAHQPMDRLNFFVSLLPTSIDTVESLDRKAPIKVKLVTDSDGNELTWAQFAPWLGTIFLDKEMQPGELVDIRMVWDNDQGIRDQNYAFKAVPRGGWFPLLRIFDLVEDFQLTVRTEEKFKVLGIGKEMSNTVEDGIRTTKWKAHNPVTFPSMVYGQYVAEPSRVKAYKLDGTEIPVVMHVDEVAMREWDLTRADLRKLADEAANSINLFSKIMNVDYPFSKLDLVNDPVPAFYGQAPSSLIYFGQAVFLTMGEISAGGGGRGDLSRLSRFLRSVCAHEVGHQWWGSSTSNANSQNYWFVESLAEYASAMYLEAAYGPKEYEHQVKEWRDTVLQADAMTSIWNADQMWGGNARQALIYNKGPLAMHMLRETFGEAKFLQFFRTLAQSLAGKQIVTRDIQTVAEAVYGGNMEWFFDQWIRGVGLPKITYNLDHRKTEDGKYLVEGKIRQELVMGEDDTVVEGAAYRALIPVLVKMKGGDEHEQFVLLDADSETDVRFSVPGEPRRIYVNYNTELLAKKVEEGAF